MKLKNIITYTVLSTVFSLFMIQPLMAQNQSFSDIESIQDEIENLYVKTYTIFEDYPNLTYEYIYDGDNLSSVKIVGVPDLQDKKRLEVYMLDIADLEDHIKNMTNRTGVYYVTEKDPKPKAGFSKFYDKLHAKIDYPDMSTQQNLEGTIYAKFVVDDQGEIDNVLLASNFEQKDNIVVEEMKEETKKAILSTSGNWEPATVGGIPVAHWMVLPVQFKTEGDFYTPMRY